MENIPETPALRPQPRFLRWSLIFAIAIVTNLFISYALSLAYKAPQWTDFCPTRQVNEPMTKDQCVSEGGQWNGTVQPSKIAAPASPQESYGYCDPNFTCQQSYEAARVAYERNIFVTLILAGVVLIALGIFIGANGVLKTALSFAGSLSLVVASVRYWGEAHDWLKVAILGIALAALIMLAVKKFSEKIRP